jgi:diadenosine tetraphosphate (Ap4A) HIT family hydrolase
LSDAPFALDPRIEGDSAPVGRLPLCVVRLMRDARYPWAVLVPARAEVREIHELAIADRAALIEESSAVASAMSRLHAADKMNVAALGNVVAQLHVHVIARRATDDAWPRPVWGAHPPVIEEPASLRARVLALRDALRGVAGFVADHD